MTLWFSACGPSPEKLLSGRWQEADWSYEKFDGYDPKEAKWFDGIRFPPFSKRRVVHHEAEYWEFLPGGKLVISKRDGTKVHARWRLKGRGHVLTVRSPGAEGLELYDVKELNAQELVLHYDIGMEVRGIAQLTFRRLAAPGDKPEAHVALGAAKHVALGAAKHAEGALP